MARCTGILAINSDGCIDLDHGRRRTDLVWPADYTADGFPTGLPWC
jgi:hypothetical protein